MLALKKIGLIFFALNFVGMVVLFSLLTENSPSSFNDHTGFIARESAKTTEELLEDNKRLKTELRELLRHQGNTSLALRESNPFYILGAYPEIGPDYVNPSYDTPNYGFMNDDDYCDVVDSYNLARQDNIFDRMNFFTDYVEKSLVRVDVMKQLGKIYADGIARNMEKKGGSLEATKHFDHRLTSFFLNNGKFHSYHKIGQHFLCATQIYNHIPGNSAATNKVKLINHLHDYNAKYIGRRQCFSKESFLPPTYRLQNKEECEEFFSIIHSRVYRELTKDEPIKYVIKSGKGVHKSDGVFLLDTNMTEKLNTDYDYGKKCGEEKQSWIAQTYIDNPLLLENSNKFDFRIYMLVASTNPLIVYYHDGFLRVSLMSYDKTSSDRATHLTNSAIVNKLIKEAKLEGTTVNNMTMEEIEESRSWDLEKLKDHLLETGRINDPDWLDNYLRPAFKKACVHLTRMTHHAFWNQSNVYELQGVDFMLDDNLKLWFIESNSSPFFNGKKRLEFFSTMLLDMFEIQYAYFRSRMQRIIKVIRSMQRDTDNKNIEKWRSKYQEAARNRLESEFEISKNNSFSIIVDEGLPGAEAYFDLISSDCI